MANNPDQNSGKLVTFKIFSNAKDIGNEYEVNAISVHKEINRIGSATLEIMGGDMPDQDFPLSNKDTLKPGNKIKIDVGYNMQEETIYEGIISSHGLRLSSNGDPLIIIECRDFAVEATIARKNQTFKDKTDSEIISQIMGNYSSFSTSVSSSLYTNKELVQYYVTDWDFILTRAKVNGLLVISDDKKLNIAEPDVNGAAVLTVSYGTDIIEFDATIDSDEQIEDIEAIGWDQATQKTVKAKGNKPNLNKQGNLSQKDLSKSSGSNTLQLQTGVNIEADALKQWASAYIQRQGLARYNGTVTFQGNANAKPGAIIELKGLGDRFNGNAFIGSIEHDISNGNWTTEINLGLHDTPTDNKDDIVAPTAAGIIPGIEGLQIAKVTKLDGDPAAENRIQVEIPILSADKNTVWARLTHFYASDATGTFFIPEVDDEVVLGFLNNDPNHPVILGSMYSSKIKPAYELTAENNTKALVTRSKMIIEFDEEKKDITIKTPGENQICISDDNKTITISDQNKNTIEMGSSGITLDSGKDITLTSKSNIQLKAAQNINIESTNDTSIKGLNISGIANVGVTMKGNATAEISASGQTTVKGALVMIN